MNQNKQPKKKESLSKSIFGGGSNTGASLNRRHTTVRANSGNNSIILASDTPDQDFFGTNNSGRMSYREPVNLNTTRLSLSPGNRCKTFKI